MADRATLAVRAWAGLPVPRDVALALGLFVVCVLVNDPHTLLRTVSDRPGGGGWGGPGVVWLWWVSAALSVAGVSLRRRRPVPMLVLCVLSVAARLGAGVPPTVVDLAVLVLLYTVADRYSRTVSLSILSGLLVLSIAWVVGGVFAGWPLRMMSLRLCDPEATRSGPGQPVSVSTFCRDGGSNQWVGLPVVGSALVAAWAVGSGGRNRRAYLDQLRTRAQDLERERGQQAALAVAAERGRISREVHDVVAHGLSLIVVQAQGAEAAMDNNPADTRSALRTIVKTGRDSLADMRRMLAALGEVEDAWHPPPGLAQLPGLLTRVRQAGTAVRLRVEGTPAALPSTVDLSAYRVVQEALTNVMKHAGAGAAADVVVSYRGTEVDIEVSDDGPATVASVGTAGDEEGGGNGLRGMRRRVTLLGGRLCAGPGARGGFVVRASLPTRESGS